MSTSRKRRNATEQKAIEQRTIPAISIPVLSSSELTMGNVIHTLRNITGYLESKPSDQTLRDKINEQQDQISALQGQISALQDQSLAKDRQALILVKRNNQSTTDLIKAEESIRDLTRQRKEADELILKVTKELEKEPQGRHGTRQLAAVSFNQSQTIAFPAVLIASNSQMDSLMIELTRLQTENEAQKRQIDQQTSEIAVMKLRSLGAESSSSSFRLFGQTTTPSHTAAEKKEESNKRRRSGSYPAGPS